MNYPPGFTQWDHDQRFNRKPTAIEADMSRDEPIVRKLLKQTSDLYDAIIATDLYSDAGQEAQTEASNVIDYAMGRLKKFLDEVE
jgi:hypothetical protein